MLLLPSWDRWIQRKLIIAGILDEVSVTRLTLRRTTMATAVTTVPITATDSTTTTGLATVIPTFARVSASRSVQVEAVSALEHSVDRTAIAAIHTAAIGTEISLLLTAEAESVP